MNTKSQLERRLRSEVTGEVLFDRFSRASEYGRGVSSKDSSPP